MLSKINKMLRQQEGFTLMELMIVVVILGILMAIAIPIYNGVQERAKYAVGEANATVLNRGITQLEKLGYYDGNTLYTIEGDYDPEGTGVGEDEKDTMNQQDMLLKFVGLDEDLIAYVKWAPKHVDDDTGVTTPGEYVVDTEAETLEL
jgi:prepilin-type N-terminal cleavage/methylation domain-containing protein